MNCWPTMPVAPRMPTGIEAIELPTQFLSPKKKPTRLKPCRQVFSSIEIVERLAVEHNSSNTGGPLSTGPLSSVGNSVHCRCTTYSGRLNRLSIAWEVDASSVLPRLGAPARLSHDRSRRASVRLGARLDSAPTGTVGASRTGGSLAHWVDGRDGRHRRLLHAGADDRLRRSAPPSADGDRLLTFPSALTDAARGEQHGLHAAVPGARERRDRPASRGRPGAAAVELRTRAAMSGSAGCWR